MMTVAGYVRVSKEEQAEKDISIPAQKSRIMSYCQSQGWELHDLYVDDGYSAKDLNRPEMKRMIKDVTSKKFNTIVVVRLDRISRSQKDVLYLIEDIFEPANIGFKSVTQTFDTTTAFGKAAIGMIAVFAQLERDQLIERVGEAKKKPLSKVASWADQQLSAMNTTRQPKALPLTKWKPRSSGESMKIIYVVRQAIRLLQTN